MVSSIYLTIVWVQSVGTQSLLRVLGVMLVSLICVFTVSQPLGKVLVYEASRY